MISLEDIFSVRWVSTNEMRNASFILAKSIKMEGVLLVVMEI